MNVILKRSNNTPMNQIVFFMHFIRISVSKKKNHLHIWKLETTKPNKYMKGFQIENWNCDVHCVCVCVCACVYMCNVQCATQVTLTKMDRR